MKNPPRMRAALIEGDCLKTQSPSVKFDGKDKKRH